MPSELHAETRDRAQANDNALATMEPADTFTLTLRGYQKQALQSAFGPAVLLYLTNFRWMQSRETGLQSTRQADSMHPLWDQSAACLSHAVRSLTRFIRYVFPTEPMHGVIDLTAADRHFYFNSYSGELSLDFPKADTFSSGGILADGKWRSI
jgi:DNA repair protein RAD5